MVVASVTLENQTPETVTFWLYDAADNSARDSTVLAAGQTMVTIPVGETRLIGAWYATPPTGSLYPSNATPFTVVATPPDDKRNYVVVLNSGGISFGPQ